MTTGEDKATELARLQAENEELRTALEEEKKSMGRVRSFIVWTLIVLGCISAILAVTGIWARTTALDTDAFVDTVGPLPQDPDVSLALAQTVTEQVYADANLEQTIEQELPEGLAFLASPVAAGVQDLSTELGQRIISSDAFTSVWDRLIRTAHGTAVAVLTGRENIEITQEGDVVLDLADTASEIRGALEEAGLGDVLPPPREEGATVVLFDDTDLGVLRLTVDLLDTAYWGLPILTLILLGAALWISTDRRRTWFRIGIGLALAMVASLIVLDLSRGAIVDGIEDPVQQAGVSALWTQLFSGFTGLQAAVFVLSLIIAVTAYLFGPHRWAVSFRRSVRNRVDGWRTGERVTGVQEDAFGAFLTRHLAAVRSVGIALSLIFMLAWPRLTVGIVLVTLIGLVIYLFAVELLRAPRPEAPEIQQPTPVTAAAEEAAEEKTPAETTE